MKNMKPPTFRKEVHRFIGIVNYYRGMWERLSHILSPLTNITSSKVQFNWTAIEQDAFDEINRIVARNNLVSYLD